MDSRLDPYLDIDRDLLGQEDDLDNFDEFESVPLPNQVNQAEAKPEHPQPAVKTFEIETPSVEMDSTVSKSRTLQTLMSQNQDFMARLTVALKRNVELEQRIETQEEIYQKLSSQYEILKDRAGVSEEKAKQAEFENQKLFAKNSAHEKRFAELYSAYQDKVSQIKSLSYRLHRYLQYRRRVKGIVRPFIEKLKSEVENLKNQVLVINEQGIKQLEYINELKAKYADAIDRIQAINVQNEKTQADLTEYHETRYQKASQELETIRVEVTALRDQNHELKLSVESLTENEASLSNKAIFYERKYTDLKNEFETVSQEFIQQKTSDNTRLTQLEIQLKETSSKLSAISTKKTELESENQSMNDQYQSLQLIYQDSLSKIEELTKSSSAQDKINKELSQSLTEYRKKSEHLEQKLQQTEEDFKRKLQAFQVRFNKVPQDGSPLKQIAESSAGQKELLSKIQTLLAEIQTGKNLSDLDFQEAAKPHGNELISEFGDIET